MNKQVEFLHRAVEESQLNIRALDVKVGALMTGLLLPLSAASRIFSHLENFYHLYPSWPLFLINIGFLLLWLLALAALVLAIAPIHNPAIHIPNVKLYQGSFYAGGLFDLRLHHVFLLRNEVIAKKSPEQYSSTLPTTDKEVVNELSFEQMKLAYIRDMKTLRLKWGMVFCALWVAAGIAIYLASRYYVPSSAG